MKKINIIADLNSRSQKIKKVIEKKLISIEINKSNLNIVIGGDGFMLKTLKKNKNYSNIFYGINSGNYGFLMNKFSINSLIINLKKSKLTKISPLRNVSNNLK